MGQYDGTLGTLLLGIILNTYLYGIVTFQFASYFNSKFDDGRWLKSAVLFLFIMDTFHSGAAIWMAWYYCVTNYTNPDSLAVAIWPYTFTPIATSVIAYITHIFLGFRIWRLTGNKPIYVCILCLGAASCALGITCGTKAWMIRTSADLAVLQPLVTAWLALQVSVDTIVTVFLTAVLYKARTGFRKTDTVINRLIRGAIQTGVFAVIFSLGDLITFLVAPETNLYGFFALPLGRIYTNTLMDTLLVRKGLQVILNGGVVETVDIPSTVRFAGYKKTEQTANTSDIQLEQLTDREDQSRELDRTKSRELNDQLTVNEATSIYTGRKDKKHNVV